MTSYRSQGFVCAMAILDILRVDLLTTHILCLVHFGCMKIERTKFDLSTPQIRSFSRIFIAMEELIRPTVYSSIEKVPQGKSSVVSLMITCIVSVIMISLF